ncbi:MAG: hypothetical protein DRH04_11045 [Deltaproteobacteria bacterium]|nr:MAG: hypothetical protein DRH04_11045 [Deltaproteobacteria bacterium]
MDQNNSDGPALVLYRQTADVVNLKEIVKRWLRAAKKDNADQMFFLLAEGFPKNRFIDIDNGPDQLENFLSDPGDCTTFHLFSGQRYLRGARRLDGGKQDKFKLLATCPGDDSTWDPIAIQYAGELETKTYALWGRWNDSSKCYFENQIPRKLFYPIVLERERRAALQTREYFDDEHHLVFYAFSGLVKQPEIK